MTTGNLGGGAVDVNALLVQGFKAAKENRRDEAYQIFVSVVQRDPMSEMGWLYRAATTDNLSESYVCLQKVLSINPANEKAQRGVERIQSRLGNEGDEFGDAATPPPGVPLMGDDVVSGFNRPPAGMFSGSDNTQRPAPPPPAINFNQPGFDQPNFNSAETATFQRPPANYGAPQNFQEGFEQPDFANFNNGSNDAGGFPGFNMGGQGQGAAQGGYENVPDFQQQPGYDNYQPPAQGGYNNTQNAGYPDEFVPPPVAGAAGGNPRSNRNNRNTRQQTGGAFAPAFGQLSKVRNRSRAAFGTETATGLNEVGQNRARRILYILGGFGLLLVLAFLLISFLTKPNPEGEVGAATATASSLLPTVNPIFTASIITLAPTQLPGLPTFTPAPVRPTNPAVQPPVPTPPSPQIQPTRGAPTFTPVGPRPSPVIQPTQGPQPPVPPSQTPQIQPPVQPPVPLPGVPPRPVVYVIQGGNSLAYIARIYSTSQEAILAANASINPTTKLIFPNQRLVVPVSRPDFRGKGAILENGVTLGSLAALNRQVPDQIAQFNGYNNAGEVPAGAAILIP